MTAINKLENKISKEMQDKHYAVFEKQARYKGSGVYFIPMTDLYSSDIRELFLRFVAAREGILLKNI